MEGNVGTRSGWWFSADRKWRKGKPPEGWQQGPDGRWHSPYSAETEELTYLARTAAAAKRAESGASPADEGEDGGPSWAAVTGFPSSPNVPEADEAAYPGLAERWSDDDDAAVAALGSAGEATVFALDPVYEGEAAAGPDPSDASDHGYADDGYADDGYPDDDYEDYEDEDGYEEPIGGPGRGAGRHLADDDLSSRRISYGGWPSWARVAAPVAAGVCLLGALGAVALGSGGSSSDETAGGTVPTTDTTIGMPDDPGPVTGGGGTGSAITSSTTTAPADGTTPSTTAADDAPPSTEPSDDSSPSTTAPATPPDPAPGGPATTAPPARNDDPPEACDPGQGRSLTWYLLNLDPDGDGQICE
jgi:hypothetical protein